MDLKHMRAPSSVAKAPGIGAPRPMSPFSFQTPKRLRFGSLLLSSPEKKLHSIQRALSASSLYQRESIMESMKLRQSLWSPLIYTKLLLNSRALLMRMLTYETVENAIKQRVETKAKVFGQEVAVGSNENQDPPVYKIRPSLVAELYGDWIMPLTKEVQVEYLLRRLD